MLIYLDYPEKHQNYTESSVTKKNGHVSEASDLSRNNNKRAEPDFFQRKITFESMKF